MIDPEATKDAHPSSKSKEGGTSDRVPLVERIISLLPDYTVKEINLHDTLSLSPQSLAFQWILQDPNVDNYEDWRIVQRYALGTFYFATGGTQSWKENTNWMSYDHHVSYCNRHDQDHTNESSPQ